MRALGAALVLLGAAGGYLLRRREQLLQQLGPVPVKGVVGIMGMGVKQRHGAPPVSAFALL